MAHVVDLTDSDGDYVIIGKSLVFPHSSTDSAPNPFTAAARYNPATESGQFYINGVWVDFARRRLYLVAELPAGAPTGTTAFATNGRKVGQGAGSGTGVPVYKDSTGWRRYSDDTIVAA
jgi:hypothetical protein